MAIATGVNKVLGYKVESAWGTLPAAGSWQLLRRVTSTLNLEKDTYQSNEIRSDYQVADFRHGMRKVTGTIAGEISPGTYKDFIAAACRRAFASVTAITGVSLTIASSGSFWTITRSAGDWITGNIRAGMVGRITAGAVNALNLNKNVAVVSMTTTVLTVATLDGSSLFAEGPIASCTFTVTGKVTYVPSSGHTDNSFAFEEWHGDVSQSERFLGNKVSQLDLDLPATGMSTINIGFMGKDMATDVTQYMTSPSAAGTTGVCAAVNGILVVGGTKIVTLTGLKLSINGNMTSEAVVGSNTAPDIFEGRVVVTGSFDQFFENGTNRDVFLNETEIALFFVLTTNNTATADFVAGYLPRIKLGSASKDDGDKGIKRSHSFTALLMGSNSTGNETTTVQFQDSQA